MSNFDTRVQWTFTETYLIFSRLVQQIGLEPSKTFAICKLLFGLQKEIFKEDRLKPSVGSNIASDFLNFQAELRREEERSGKQVAPLPDLSVLQTYANTLQEMSEALKRFSPDSANSNQQAKVEDPPQALAVIEPEADLPKLKVKPPASVIKPKPLGIVTGEVALNISPRLLIEDQKRLRIAVVGARFDWRDPIQREFGTVLKLLFFDDGSKRPEYSIDYDHVFIFTGHTSADLIRYFQLGWSTKSKIHLLAAGVPSLKIDLAELKQEALNAGRR